MRSLKDRSFEELDMKSSKDLNLEDVRNIFVSKGTVSTEEIFARL